MIKRRDCYVILGLILLISAIYSLSVFDVPGADTIQYWYITNYLHGYENLLIHTYNLNRTATPHLADALLFRPLLYALMATERYVFGFDFYFWQLLNIVAHIAISITLYFYLRLLNHNTKESFPLTATLTFIFAALFSGCSLVMWAQLTGYLFCFFFILLSLIFFERYIRRPNLANLIFSFLFMIIASYFYEIGLVASLVLACRASYHLLFKKNKAYYLPAALFILLPCIYLFFTFQYISHNPPTIGNSHQSFFFYIQQSCFIASYVFLEWLANSLTPFFLAQHVYEGARLVSNVPSLYSCGFIIVIATGGIWAAMRALKPRPNWEVFFFSLLFLFGYLIVATVGRGMIRGVDYILATNPYYYYLFSLFLIIMLASLFRSPQVTPTPRQKSFFCAALIFVFLMNFTLVIAINHQQYIGYSKPVSQLYYKIVNFINTHRENSKKPTFAIEGNCPANFKTSWISKWSLQSNLLTFIPKNSYEHKTYAQDIFSTYYDKKNPEYILHCQEGKMWFAPAQKNLASKTAS